MQRFEIMPALVKYCPSGVGVAGFDNVLLMDGGWVDTDGLDGSSSDTGIH